MKVWLASLRRGISYHGIAESGRVTTCGRFFGVNPDATPAKGHVLPIVRAVDDYAAVACRACDGQRTPPRILPGRGSR
jgi:hypothetical protein